MVTLTFLDLQLLNGHLSRFDDLLGVEHSPKATLPFCVDREPAASIRLANNLLAAFIKLSTVNDLHPAFFQDIVELVNSLCILEGPLRPDHSTAEYDW